MYGFINFIVSSTNQYIPFLFTDKELEELGIDEDNLTIGDNGDIIIPKGNWLVIWIPSKLKQYTKSFIDWRINIYGTKEYFKEIFKSLH